MPRSALPGRPPGRLPPNLSPFISADPSGVGVSHTPPPARRARLRRVGSALGRDAPTPGRAPAAPPPVGTSRAPPPAAPPPLPPSRRHPPLAGRPDSWTAPGTAPGRLRPGGETGMAPPRQGNGNRNSAGAAAAGGGARAAGARDPRSREAPEPRAGNVRAAGLWRTAGSPPGLREAAAAQGQAGGEGRPESGRKGAGPFRGEKAPV